MGKIMMCGSFKGGVGKTASSWNLAYCLAEMGKKVLAVDFDSQANLSTCFGIEDTVTVPVTIGHLMMNQLEDEKQPEPAEFIQKRNGVDFIPSSMMLSAVDSRLRMEIGAERMLAFILEPLRDRYDFVIVDTCPSLGALTINALAAADEVIITVNPQLLAMMGLQGFIRTVKKVRNRLMRLNYLIPKFKEQVDDGRLPFMAAVHLSYLGEGEQELLHQAAEQAGQKLRPKQAMELRKQAGKIDREAVDVVFRERDKPEGEKRMVKLLIDAAVYKEYLADVEEADVSGIMEKALRMYFGKAV